MKTKHNKIIMDWMINTIQKGTWKNYDDLHIDEIDKSCKKPLSWIECSLKYFREAIEIRDYLNLPFIILIGMGPDSSPDSKNIDIKDLSEIKNILSDTPPSLYLFASQWENWKEMLKSGVELSPRLSGIDNTKTLFYEFFDERDKEYRRSLWFWSPSTQ